MFGSKVIGVLRLKAPDSTEGIRAASPRMSFVLKINSFTVEVGVGFVILKTPYNLSSMFASLIYFL